MLAKSWSIYLPDDNAAAGVTRAEKTFDADCITYTRPLTELMTSLGAERGAGWRAAVLMRWTRGY